MNGLFLDKKHVPYRDSKLTRILKPSLSGKGKVLLIANMSPTLSNMTESLSTLRFADRVKEMKAPEAGDNFDTKKDNEFLNILKVNEKLSAELRIACQAYGFAPQLTQLYNTLDDKQLKEKSKQIIAEYSKKALQEQEAEAERKRKLQEEVARVCNVYYSHCFRKWNYNCMSIGMARLIWLNKL